MLYVSSQMLEARKEGNEVENGSLSSLAVKTRAVDASNPQNQPGSSVQEENKPHREPSLTSAIVMTVPEKSTPKMKSSTTLVSSAHATGTEIEDSEADNQDSSANEETKPDNIGGGDLGPSCKLSSRPRRAKSRSMSLSHASTSKKKSHRERKHQSTKSSINLSGLVRNLWSRQTISITKRKSVGALNKSKSLMSSLEANRSTSSINSTGSASSIRSANSIHSKSGIIYPSVKGFPFQVIVKEDNRKRRYTRFQKVDLSSGWRPNYHKTNNVLCTGWLCKQPIGKHGLEHSDALTRGWKVRFFCLEKHALSYYHYKKKTMRLKLKGAMRLDHTCRVFRENKTSFRVVKGSSTLAIKTPDNAMAMTKIPGRLKIVQYPEGDYTPTKACSMWVQNIVKVISPHKKQFSEMDETVERMRREGMLSDEEYKSFVREFGVTTPVQGRRSMLHLPHQQSSTHSAASKDISPASANKGQRKPYKVSKREIKNLDDLAFPDLLELDTQMFFEPLDLVPIIGKHLSSKARQQINDVIKNFNVLVLTLNPCVSPKGEVDPASEELVRKRFSKMSMVLAYLTAELNDAMKNYKGNKLKLSVANFAQPGGLSKVKGGKEKADKMLYRLGIGKLLYDLIFYEKLVAVLVRVEHYAGLTISNFQLTPRQSALWKIVEKIAVFKGVAKPMVAQRIQHRRKRTIMHKTSRTSREGYDLEAVGAIMERIKAVAENTIYYLERVRTLEATIIPTDPDVFIRRVENSAFKATEKFETPKKPFVGNKFLNGDISAVGGSKSSPEQQSSLRKSISMVNLHDVQSPPGAVGFDSSDTPSPAKLKVMSPELSQFLEEDMEVSKSERRTLQGGYWLEACSGPLHFPMHQLLRYYRHWKIGFKNMMSFARYMAVFPMRMLRASNIQKLAKRDLQAFQHLVEAGLANGLRDEGVTYLDPTERQQYLIKINNDGLLVEAKGAFFSTVEMSTGHSGKGWAMVVYRQDAGMFCATHITDRFHHSTIFGGDSVDFAGELQVRDGHLLHANNKSGHYKPGEPETVKFLSFLQSSGVQLDGVRFDVYSDVKTIVGSTGATPRDKQADVRTCSAKELLDSVDDDNDSSSSEDSENDKNDDFDV